MTVKERIKRGPGLFIFLTAFILVGFAVLTCGLVRIGRYLNADIKSATVISAEYGAGETAAVEFEYLNGGETVTVKAKLEGVKPFDKQGHRPYYEGKEVNLRLSKSGKVLQYTKLDTLILICGAAFLLAGATFLYYMFLRNPSAIDLALSYEQAMLPPENYTDETQRTEARADELSKIGRKEAEYLTGQAHVWRRRLGDRVKTFTPLQNIAFTALLIAPPLACNIYRAVLSGKFNFGLFFAELFFWILCICPIGFLFKLFYFMFLKSEVRAGKYTVKKTAIVKACAFEAESYIATGSFERVHIINRKFRVVAEIDGKRSVGYVYGNVPPPRGAVLRVLVRKRNTRRFIIDQDNKG